MDGPTTRLAVTMDELSAMAFERCERSSTISTTNACRAGVSNALMIPCATWRIRMWVTVITPANVSAASATDCSIERNCVMSKMR